MWLRIFALIAFSLGVQASHFRGSYITWVVNQTDYNYYPANEYASLAKVHVKYGTSWRRTDGSSYCTNHSISTCQFFSHGSWNLYYGLNVSYPQSYHSSFSAGYYCERYNVQYDFTVGSNKVTLYLPKAYTYRARTSSCCWVYGLKYYSSSSWNVETVVSLAKRSAGYGIYKVNTPPQISHIPIIQHSVNSYQNYKLPVHDPDGDQIQCRWAANFSEGGGVWNSRIPSASLSSNCVLTIPYYVSAGWYALAVMIEDYAYNYVTYRYDKQSSIPLQFTVYIYNNATTTIYGDNSTDCGTSQQFSVAINQTTRYVMATPTATPQTTPVMATATISPMQALDGCQYYQVLSEEDRSSTFRDWSSYRCDAELYGWYRFMGRAGNRMATACPNYAGYNYWCGSYYQGWIPSGGMPSVYDGVVSRYVCFSRYGYCSCTWSKSIMVKNCGSFYVYYLNGVPGCNSRYCGVKDNSATVSCSNNYMRIELDRKFYNASLYSSITLRMESCKASIYSSSIVLGSVPGACGSVRSETSSHIVYENEVIFTGKPINGLITRNVDQRVKFSCMYDKNAYVQTVSYQPVSNVTGVEVGYGNFTFNFVMYTDHRYVTMHSYYPVSVNLRDWIYLEVYANNIDNNIIVLVDQCFSTPNMDRHHPMKYTFISNRCPSDNTVQFYSASNNRQRFGIQAFKYFNSSTAVYFHCLVFLCHSTSTDWRCRSGCAGNNIHRGKRAIDNRDEQAPSSVYMVEMQVLLKNEKGSEDKSKGTPFAVSTIGLVVGLAVAVAAVAGLGWKVHKLAKLSKVEPREERYADMADDTCKAIPERQIEYNDDMADLGVISKEKQAELFKDKVMYS